MSLADHGSFKEEVIADGSKEWVSNGLRFMTKDEADAYGKDLKWRWLSVREVRTVVSSDTPNYSYKDGTLTQLEVPEVELDLVSKTA